MRYWIIFVIILIICEIWNVSDARIYRRISKRRGRKSRTGKRNLAKCQDCAKLFRLPATFKIGKSKYTYAHVSIDHLAYCYMISI